MGSWEALHDARKEIIPVNDSTALDKGMQEKRTIHSLSWEEFDQLIASLIEHIRADGCPDIIVGLQRGGLVPAVLLSHQLEVPGFLTFPVRTTTSDAVYASKHVPVVLPNDLSTQIGGKDILVVDDVVGSGATLRMVLSLLCRYAPARLRSVIPILNREHWNPVNGQEPAAVITYIGKELCGWVVFPWEKSVHGKTEQMGAVSLPSPSSL
jgi:hypoxanthine phosphoribosyltransferase